MFSCKVFWKFNSFLMFCCVTQSTTSPWSSTGPRQWHTRSRSVFTSFESVFSRVTSPWPCCLAFLELFPGCSPSQLYTSHKGLQINLKGKNWPFSSGQCVYTGRKYCTCIFRWSFFQSLLNALTRSPLETIWFYTWFIFLGKQPSIVELF